MEPKTADIFLNKKFWRYMVPQEERRKLLFRKLYTSNSVFYSSNPSLQRPLIPHAIHRLDEIQKPTLIIEAEDDHPFNKKACEILHTKVKGATKVVIKNSGHYPHLEHPSEFNATLLKFLQA